VRRYNSSTLVGRCASGMGSANTACTSPIAVSPIPPIGSTKPPRGGWRCRCCRYLSSESCTTSRYLRTRVFAPLPGKEPGMSTSAAALLMSLDHTTETSHRTSW
jgi:hypothetical protein